MICPRPRRVLFGVLASILILTSSLSLAGNVWANCPYAPACGYYATYTCDNQCWYERWRSYQTRTVEVGHLVIFGENNLDLDEATIAQQSQAALDKWRTAESQLPICTTQISNVGGFSSVRFMNEDTFVALYPGLGAGVAGVSWRGYEDLACKVINRGWTDFRDKSTWSWGASPGAQYYTQEMMLHEFGHWWRLRHPEEDPRQLCQAVTVMRGVHTEYMYESELTNDDKDAVNALYDTETLIVGSLNATAAAGAVDLTWEDAGAGSGGFTIYRGNNCNGPYSTLIANIQRYDPQYTSDNIHYLYRDGSVTHERPYYYLIVDDEASDAAGATPYGLPLPSDPSPPTGVSTLRDDSILGRERVVVSWTASSGATGYRIYRKTGGDLVACDDDIELVGATSGNEFVDEDVPGSGRLAYAIVAMDNDGESQYSSSAAICLVADIETPVDTTLTVCPMGDEDRIHLAVRIDGACGVSIGDGGSLLRLVRDASSGSGVVFWGVTPGGAAVQDSAAAVLFDVSTQRAIFIIDRISGCGRLVVRIVADGIALSGAMGFDVRSVDGNSLSLGAVDRFDYAEVQSVFGQGVACWDLDRSGGPVDIGDLAMIGTHYMERHHTVRKVLAPNGGESIAPGDAMHIAWQRGLGDSARVTLRVVHSVPADTSLIVADVVDTGYYTWTVPVTNKAGTNARVEVVHSAGYYMVDYAGVGKDASDETMTFHATAVADLSAVTGKNTAVLTWSDPTQGTLAAEEHEIWYRHTTPMTNEDYTTGSTKLTYAPTPGIAGTTHCVEINALTQCKTYYFGMRTKDRGVWSKLSNVAVSQTDCSGFEVVFCEESGLMAGGGGGEEGVQATRLASATSPLSVVGTDVTVGNSLLCGNRGVMAQDLYRLTTTGSALSDRVSEVVLRESALREALVDAVGLGVVAHPSGTEALPGGGAIWIGSRQRIDQARDAAGADVSAGLAAADEDGMAFRGGDFVTIELGGDTRQTALVLESRNQVFAARDDSSGILVQRPDRSGAWTTVARVQPRSGFDRQAIPAEGATRLRLVFLKEYSLRAIERLDGITAATPRTLALADAIHSKLGSVDGSVDRSGGEKTSLAMGDTLALRFTPLEPEAGMDHSYFFSIWGSIETAAEETRLQDAASLVVAADPVFANTLGTARPNPTTGGAIIAYTLAAPDQAELTIYNVSGRRIRTVLKAELPAGAHEVQWDGKDTGGRAVPAGVYFYRLRAGGWQSERKLIVLQR